MENPPSKLTFEHWNEKVTIELPNSDIDVEQYFDMCRQIAKAVGFSESLIKEYFE